jgi:hypothetical protein
MPFAIIAMPSRSTGTSRSRTRDVRHFAAVRLRDGSAFDLVVHPSNPDE